MKHSCSQALLLSMLAASGAFGVACFSSSAGPGSADGGELDAQFDGFVGDSTLPEEAAADGAFEAAVDSSVEAGGDGPLASDTGVDVTQSDSGADAGLDVAADGAPDGPAIVSFYVNPVSGSDTNDGSMGAPFQSIVHASQAMNTVDAGGGPFDLYLADGTYSVTNQTAGLQVTFTHTTFVHGSAPGNVIILGQGPVGAQEGLLFQQGGGVVNVTFKDTWYGVEGLHGNLSIAGCSFDGAGGGGYFAGFINDTVGTFDTTGNVTLKNFTGAFGEIYVDQTATVSWIGGGTTSITGGMAGTNLVFVRGGAQLTIDGINVTSYLGYFLVGYDQSQVTIKNSTFTGSGFAAGTGGLTTAGLIYLGQSQTGAPATSLTLSNTTITGSLGSAVAYELLPNTASITFNATSAHLDNGTLAGIWVNGPANTTAAIDLTATGTTFDGNGLPAIYAPHATVSLTGAGSSVRTNGAMAGSFGQTPGGIVLTDGTAASSVTLRNVTVASDTGNLILFNGTASSTLDLGTFASPGGNAFSGVTVGASPLAAVNLSALIAASAIGNTWMPSVQGANAAGQYTTSTTITGPASGQNVIEPAGASIVMAP